MNNAEDALARWTDVVDASPMPDAARDDARRRMLEAFDAQVDVPDSPMPPIVTVVPESNTTVTTQLVVQSIGSRRQRRLVSLSAAAAAVFVLVVIVAFRTRGSTIDIAEPAINVDSTVVSGTSISAGTYLVDDFAIPFILQSSSDWTVRTERRSLVVLTDPSTDWADPSNPELIDIRALSVRLFNDSALVPTVEDVERLFRTPPAGVTVRKLEPIDLSGTLGRRIVVDVAADAECVGDDVLCLQFPSTGSNSQPLSRDRTYTLVAAPTPEGIVVASIVQVDDRDAWNAAGLAALESLQFVSAPDGADDTQTDPEGVDR